MIIGLSGYANSGKDEIARTLVKLDNSFHIKKFASKLKQIASILTGYPEEMFEDRVFKSQPLNSAWWKGRKTITGREFLQKLGTECIRDVLHPDAWVNALMWEYNKPYPNWIITDCRFINEAITIKKYGGIMVRVNRADTYPANTHTSETELDYWPFDYVIENTSSLDELKHNVEIFFNNYTSKRNG